MEFMKFDERPVLRSLGSVRMDKAKAKATREMAAYKSKLRLAKEAEGEAALRDVVAGTKTIGKQRKPRKQTSGNKA